MSKLAGFLKSDRLSFVIRLLIGGLILYAEVPKLADIEKYSVYAIYKYDFFPMHANILGQTVNIAHFLGSIAPFIGVLVGLGLVFGVLTRLSAVGWLSMCVMFIIMKINFMYVLGRPPAPCGCFTGFLANLYMNQSIWIDIISIPLMLQVILANRERKFLAVWSLLPAKIRGSWLRIIW